MQKEFIFLGGSLRTTQALLEQIKEYIPRDINAQGLCFHAGIKEPVSGKLVIFSSKEVYEDVRAKNLLGTIDQSFICNRTINYENIEEVVNLPQRTKVLFVNDKEETAQICIDDMLEMGINHIEYVAYYPTMAVKPDLDGIRIAITPGEVDKVPAEIGQVIDIGTRVIDIISLYKIMALLGLGESQVDQALKKYLKKIIHVARKAAAMNAEVDVLKRNIRHEALTRGYFAQYRLNDIVGNSPGICKSKERAEKLAKTELTILIEGESGTGKELFASAIHNASPRKDRAFMAVNFSALPEELVESELFGYVEGAFTGAKKGGKAGIFEMADGGTIFLDEIGDISPRVQTKLLRVLQEKEIMSVGDTKIKKVDIRIIAATNKDLARLVEENSFRSDLYYRLKVGQIFIPPLRSRKEDIILLIDHFLKQKAPNENIRMDGEVLQVLVDYDWKGNVRELEGMLQYMLAIRASDSLTSEDLPDMHFLSPANQSRDGHIRGILTQEEEHVLRIARKLIDAKGAAGRQSISKKLCEEGLACSPGQVRRILKLLEDKGYLTVSRGSKGVSLASNDA